MTLLLVKESNHESYIKGYKFRALHNVRMKVQPDLRNSISSLGEIPSLEDGEFIILSLESNSKWDMLHLFQT